MNFFPMGSTPYMIARLRPDADFYGVLIGTAGTIIQTMITVGFVLWIAREFHLPKGAYTVIFTFYGLFLSLLDPELAPWAIFGLLGISLDIYYALVKPDATRRIRFLLFALYTSGMMWLICYSSFIVIFGKQTLYYSGYNLFGSIAQGMMMGLLVAYLMSMPSGRAIIADSENNANA